jgi:hypothetical protein
MPGRTGTLLNRIHRQEAWSVSTPPRIRPTDAPAELVAEKTLGARPR